jgi:hypothetical protein
MKSTVLTKAISGVRRYTAASSLVSNPTSKFSSTETSRSLSASDRAVGPILAAQPQVRDNPINVFFFKKPIIYSLLQIQCYKTPLIRILLDGAMVFLRFAD